MVWKQNDSYSTFTLLVLRGHQEQHGTLSLFHSKSFQIPGFTTMALSTGCSIRPVPNRNLFEIPVTAVMTELVSNDTLVQLQFDL